MPRLRAQPTSALLAAGLAGRAARLRLAAVPIVQSGVAAGLAWLLARDVLGHPAPFFAPIAALIVLGVAPGQPTSRAIELAVGVAVGVAVGDLLVAVIGAGPLQMAAVVMLAMATAVLAGGGPLLIVQSASSAILIVALARPDGGLVPTRLADAVLGAGLGVAVLAAIPRNPLRLVERALEGVLAELAATLDDLAAALDALDPAAARAALGRARALDGPLAELASDVVLARETTRLAPLWWRVRERIGLLGDASAHVDLAVRNARVLARATGRACELKTELPPAAAASVRALAGAVREVSLALRRDAPPDAAVVAVLGAAQVAAAALAADRGLSVSALVSQVRSTCLDLLRALGLPREEAVRRVRRASRR